MPHYTEDFKNHAVELSQDPNKTIRGVAFELGVCVKTLHIWRVERGARKKRHKVYTPEEKAQALELSQDPRRAVWDVAIETGVDYQTLCKWRRWAKLVKPVKGYT